LLDGFIALQKTATTNSQKRLDCTSAKDHVKNNQQKQRNSGRPSGVAILKLQNYAFIPQS
jgi:hypothetical protein